VSTQHDWDLKQGSLDIGPSALAIEAKLLLTQSFGIVARLIIVGFIRRLKEIVWR